VNLSEPDPETELIKLFILLLKKKKIKCETLIKKILCDEKNENMPGPVRTEI